VTEGKTDIVYLRTALKALHAKFPDLITLKNGEADLSVQFLPSSINNISVLNLGQGYSGMSGLISTYRNELRRYGFRPMEHPVILVVDNDDGGNKVIKAGEKLSGTKFDQTKQDFFSVTENLYIVLTPLGPFGEPSAIESCFPKSVLDQEIDGKKFDPKKSDGDGTYFGKHVFAEKIVRPGLGTIDFSGFEPILSGVSLAIADYRKKVAAAKATVKKSA
jgi:hypothetical protein